MTVDIGQNKRRKLNDPLSYIPIDIWAVVIGSIKKDGRDAKYCIRLERETTMYTIPYFGWL